MKKLTMILFLMALLTVAMPSGAVDANAVRVGLKYGAGAVSSVTISSSDGITVYNGAGYAQAVGDTVTVQLTEQGFVADNGAFTIADEAITIRAGGDYIRCDGAVYRGYIELSRKYGNAITVVNVIDLERYLYSVLGKEMSASWPAEALKAQAVCARNYVLAERPHHSAYGFDVCTTTDCQVYAGVSSESQTTIAAVEATRGKTATYQGQVVPLYFFATSGGFTESAEYVWGSSIGYLKSVEDSYENPSRASRYVWKQTVSAEEIMRRLQAKGVAIGALTDIVIDTTSATGRVTKLTFVGTEASHSVERESCRTLLGTDLLYSQNFTIEKTGGEKTPVLIATSGAPLPQSPLAITGSGLHPIAGYHLIGANGAVTAKSAVQDVAKTYTFHGRGYGHGVGMSQWGAYGMAENGFGYADILKHYFTNIEIK